jgi:hypothetical protein
MDFLFLRIIEALSVILAMFAVNMVSSRIENRNRAATKGMTPRQDESISCCA